MRFLRFPPSIGSVLPRTAETLGLAAAGGLALGALGFPAGWLSGAMLAVGAAALLKRPVLLPEPLIRVTFVLMGTSLGAAVTPETLARMGSWPASLALLTLAMVVLTVAVTAYLVRVHGWDRGSALLASFPGALSTSVVLAAQYGADVRGVAMVQTLRVAVLTLLIPVAVVSLGLGGVPVPKPPAPAGADPVGLAVLVAASTATALVAHRLRFPGGLIFGAMLASAVLHGTGLITATLPPAVTVAVFITLGGLIGTRFANTDLRLLVHLGAAALGAFVVGTAVAMVFALAGALILSLGVGETVIAYAPGAIDAMMILALALHLDPVFIAAHHVARLLLVMMTMPLVVRFAQRASPPAVTAAPERPFEDPPG